MGYPAGRVVRSTAGRDKDTFLAVVGMDGEACLLCDGKERPLNRPKRKNPKHLAATNWLLTEEQMNTNRALRKALRELAERGPKAEREACTCPNRI